MTSTKKSLDIASSDLSDYYSKISEIGTLFSPNKAKILFYLPKEEKKAIKFKNIQKEASLDQKNLRKILKVLINANLIAKTSKLRKTGKKEKWVESHPHYYLTELGFAIKTSLVEITKNFMQFNKEKIKKSIDLTQYLPEVDSLDNEKIHSVIIKEIEKIHQMYPSSEVYDIDDYETKLESGEFYVDKMDKTSAYHIYFELKEKIIVIGVFPQEELEELYSILRNKIPLLYENSHIKARLLNPSSILM